MLRYSLLAGFIAFLSIYAFRDWFKSLCALVLLMAVLERPDMPRTLMDIPGLNVWNILMFFVLLGWLGSKKREKRFWDMPGYMSFLLLAYVFVITVSGLRLVIDPSPIIQYGVQINASIQLSRGGMVIDYLVNALKWLIPAVLIYDGCRTEERVKWVIAAIVAAGLFLALQIIKEMPLSLMTDGAALQKRAIHVLDHRVGYHRVDLATMMAGLSWTFYAIRLLFTNKLVRLILLGCAGLAFLALALTGGRSGYLAWGGCGAVLALFRWRGLIVVAPALVLVALMMVPAVEERLLEGFTGDAQQKSTESLGVDTTDASGNDLYAATSGRIIVWPYVMERIAERPFFGWGRRGMVVSGALPSLIDDFGIRFKEFNHPHNAYLQLLLDVGWVGSLPIFLFFLLVLIYALRLFRRNDSLSIVVGALTFSLLITQMIASIGAQTFYPREGTVFMWAAIGLCLRLYFHPIKKGENSEPVEVKGQMKNRKYYKQNKFLPK